MNVQLFCRYDFKVCTLFVWYIAETRPAVIHMGPEIHDRPLQAASESVVLNIFALSKTVIDQVVKDIDVFCKNETKDVLIDDPGEQIIIQNLSKEQVMSNSQSLNRKLPGG